MSPEEESQMSNHHNARSGRPLVLLDTAPQPIERIFTPEAFARLHGDFEVRDITDDPGALDELVPEAFALVGQSDLPEQRLKRAGKLRAIMNVEGNFYPNIDYPTAFSRGIRVRGCGPAYAQPVAEYALGLALDLARGISREDRAFREGRERYLGAGNDAPSSSGTPTSVSHRLRQPGSSPPRAAAGLQPTNPRLRPLASRHHSPPGRPRARHPRGGPSEQPVPVRPRRSHRRQREAPRP
jgi:hypothetical protein